MSLGTRGVTRREGVANPWRGHSQIEQSGSAGGSSLPVTRPQKCEGIQDVFCLLVCLFLL